MKPLHTPVDGSKLLMCSCSFFRLEFSLLLKPRSLLILKDSLYTDFLHGIEEVTEDVISEGRVLNAVSLGVKNGERLERGTRISLTIRNVPKTSKMKLRL